VRTSRHGRPSASATRRGAIPGENGVERAQDCRERLGPAALVVLPEEASREVEPEDGECLDVRLSEVRSEDRAVGEGVAVDLTRREVRDPPAGSDGIRVLQLAEALVDVQGAGEGDRGLDALVAQTW
jgi:hypothetical protein